jgi:hypothetical protein
MEKPSVSLFVVSPLPIVIVCKCGWNQDKVRSYITRLALSHPPILFTPLCDTHLSILAFGLAMAQLRHPPQITTLPRFAITRTQLEDSDSISRYRTCEATRALAAFVGATDEELEDSQSYFSFPRTQSSDFCDSESERSYNTRATTPSDSPAVRSFMP